MLAMTNKSGWATSSTVVVIGMGLGWLCLHVPFLAVPILGTYAVLVLIVILWSRVSAWSNRRKAAAVPTPSVVPPADGGVFKRSNNLMNLGLVRMAVGIAMIVSFFIPIFWPAAPFLIGIYIAVWWRVHIYTRAERDAWKEGRLS